MKRARFFGGCVVAAIGISVAFCSCGDSTGATVGPAKVVLEAAGLRSGWPTSPRSIIVSMNLRNLGGPGDWKMLAYGPPGADSPLFESDPVSVPGFWASFYEIEVFVPDHSPLDYVKHIIIYAFNEKKKEWRETGRHAF